MNTIQDGWKKYLKLCVPPAASQGQIDATETAFYAGAIQVLGIVTQIGHSSVSETAGVSMLEMLNEEQKLFIEKMKEENKII